jgi:hypothetical protein
MISIAVEGISDAAVLERLCSLTNIPIGAQHITRGKARLDARLSGYNNAARFGQWVILRDLDHDSPCAPDLISRLLPDPAPNMCFRVPVRAVETWLLADRAGIAHFLGVAATVVPPQPDTLDNPKRALVDVARRSNKRAIREDLVPAPGTSIQVGPGYTTRLIEFASGGWDPIVAAESSPSLARCLRALSRLGS